jgi:multiple sugar transport system ATP-binding protein
VTVASDVLPATTVRAKTGGFTVGAAALLGLRPQYLTPTLDGAAGQLNGTVALSERLGSETVVQVALADGTTLIAAMPRDAEFAYKSAVGLNLNPAEAHLFLA